MEHWFWTTLIFLTLAWYLIVTVIVGIKGGQDIRDMLTKLGGEKETPKKD
ncbi:hypothetical protein QQ008_02905 [Fulvivirgaceae bacterium BMA10]|uniref:DUF1378 family protein n=1 Tax=Splendidivirga corallicola TaxID=3051826 RepID=A0ABT8KHW1_9BACT|nr:hypothetical protein [Fulvivirgaceae bacterium BMA10]